MYFIRIESFVRNMAYFEHILFFIREVNSDMPISRTNAGKNQMP